MVIIAATKNQNKIREMETITASLGMHILSRDEAGVADIEVVEDGQTFEENSFKKAMAIMKLSGEAAIADDSGLEVDALDGAPGVYSARFAGEDSSDQDNNRKLLQLLKDVPEERRTARFVCVITLVYPDGDRIIARGECSGKILCEPHGENGFGYDPLFVADGMERSFAEISPEEKNRISHRSRALHKLNDILKGNR
jgi:XTP/dITP diphosphohydrolase